MYLAPGHNLFNSSAIDCTVSKLKEPLASKSNERLFIHYITHMVREFLIPKKFSGPKVRIENMERCLAFRCILDDCKVFPKRALSRGHLFTAQYISKLRTSGSINPTNGCLYKYIHHSYGERVFILEDILRNKGMHSFASLTIAKICTA